MRKENGKMLSLPPSFLILGGIEGGILKMLAYFLVLCEDWLIFN